MTKEERQRLTEATVTLDGAPAGITGTALPFAWVRRSDNGLGAEWAWETVARIVANGGDFRS